jgi:hypothetical protein
MGNMRYTKRAEALRASFNRAFTRTPVRRRW